MALAVQCDACGAAFKVADEFAGKRGKCPKCGGVFVARPLDSNQPTPASKAAPAAGQSSKSAASNSTSGKKPATRAPEPGSASVRHSSVAKSKAKTVAPPPPPPRAVPVGSLPNESSSGILPGGSSVSKATVRPVGANLATGVRVAAGPVVSDKPAGGAATHRHARRKKGTPVWLWLVILIGGLGATGGWIFLATREDTPVADKPTAKVKVNPPATDTEEKKTAATGSKQKTAADEEEGLAEEAKGAKNSQRGAKTKAGGTGIDGPADGSQDGGAVPPADELGDALAKGNEVPLKPKAGAKPAEKQPDEGAPAKEPEPVTIEKLAELAAACQAQGWDAENVEEYAKLVALAEGMVAATTSGEDVFAAALAILNGPLREVIWTTDKVRMLNRYASKSIDKPGTGCFLMGEVTEQVDQGAVLKLVTTESLIKIDLQEPLQLAKLRPGKTFLMIGMIQPENFDLPPAKEGEPARQARVVNAVYQMAITEIYDRENSTIGPAIQPGQGN